MKFSLNNNLTLICPTPPTSGAITGGIVKIMNEFNVKSEKKTMHRFIEAMKFAYAKRSKLGDWNDLKIQKSVNDTIKYMKSDESFISKYNFFFEVLPNQKIFMDNQEKSTGET